MQALTSLATTVETTLTALAQLTDEAEQAAQQARQAGGETKLLAAVCTPAEVPGLAERNRQADELVTERLREVAESDRRAAIAEARDQLPAQATMEQLRSAYAAPRTRR